MAIIFPVQHASGPTVYYWRLIHEACDYTKGVVTQTRHGFWTPEGRSAGHGMATRKVIQGAIPADRLRRGYETGKTGFFHGAEDYLDDPWKSQHTESPSGGQP